MNASKFASGVLIAAAGYSALLLVFALVDGRPENYTAITQIALAAVLVLLVASLKLRPSYKFKLVAVLVSTGLSLLGAEMFLQFSPNRPDQVAATRITIARSENIPFDTRSRLEVLMDLRDAGIDAYPGGNGAGLLGKAEGIAEGAELYALAWRSNSTTVGCNELGERLIFQTDERGFRNPPGIWGQDRLQIVSIGDSYTAAICVPSEKVPTSLISDVYPNTLNLGISGTGPLSQLAILKEYVGDLRPQAVLWFYFEGNDLSDLVWEYYENSPGQKYLRRYLETDYRQNLASRQEEIDRGIEAKTNHQIAALTGWDTQYDLVVGRLLLRNLRTRLVKLVQGGYLNEHWAGRNTWEEFCPRDEELELLERVFADAKQHVDGWGGKLYLVYQPSWTRYADPNEACKNGNDIFHHDRILAAANNAGLSTIDMIPVFDALPDPLSAWPFRIYGHYSEKGYALVAKTVLESIRVEE